MIQNLLAMIVEEKLLNISMMVIREKEANVFIVGMNFH